MSRSFRSLVGTAALIFAVLFTIVGGGQYWFLRWQLNQKNANYHEATANDLSNQIAFTDHWDLQNYRRTPGAPENYVVLAQNGTLIDESGNSLEAMNTRVSLPFALVYDRPVHFLSDVGEVRIPVKWSADSGDVGQCRSEATLVGSYISRVDRMSQEKGR